MTEVRVEGRNYVRVGKQGVDRLILVSKDLLQEALNNLALKPKEETVEELPRMSLATMAKRELRAMKSGEFLTDATVFRPRPMTFCGIPAMLKFGGKEFFIEPHYEDSKRRDS